LSASTETTSPPWSGVKYVCKCGTRWQLEAADKCTELFIDGTAGRSFKTPPCPDCEAVSCVEVP
jgi:hypothetical protein